MRRALLLALALLAACQRSRPVTRDECDRLLDHYTELLIRTENVRLSAAEHQQLRGEIRARASVHRPFLACASELKREQMDCALAAFHPDEVERCLVPIP